MKDKVWVTYKARMNAEKRYQRLAWATHVWISAFAVVLIVISLFQTELSNSVPYLTKWTIAASVILIVVSQMAHSFDFSMSAVQHRLAYLDLQQIHDTWDKRDNPVQDYHEALTKYPNHGTIDFESFLFEYSFLQRRKIYDGEKELKPSLFVISKCASIRLLALIVTYAVPSVPFIYLFFQIP